MFYRIAVIAFLHLFIFEGQALAESKPDSAAAKKSSIKSFKDVITAKAVSKSGMFGVHKVDEKYYFEIPDSLLHREILIATRLSKTPVGSFVKFPGEVVNSKTIAFEKGPSNNLFVRVVTLVSEADSNDAISKAVKNASIDPIVFSFDIKALAHDSNGYVIDVTDFFKNDNTITGFSAQTKGQMRIGGVAADRSYLIGMNVFPLNIEVKNMRTYTLGGGAPAAAAESTPAENTGDAGAVTMELSTSLMLLPKEPMQRRLADPRIGYFDHSYTVFSDKQQQTEQKTFIARFRMEPKDEDIEKYKRGELVEPKKQIVFYTDPATPKQWRKYIIAGINEWQKAFEEAGFKNAIIGKEWPENDSSMSLEDVRYYVVRYLPAQSPNAYGSRISDPRSGEIVQAYVGWYHNIIRVLHDFYFMQAGAIDPAARSMVYSDSLMGKLIKFAITHEIGHSLGLAHNMGSSSQTPVELLRNKKWLEDNGHTASIMDYARFNYVAQPQDNLSQDEIMPRLGIYDKWAIKWGYTWMGKMNPDDEKKITAKWLSDSLKANPRLWFGGEGKNNDPRSQKEDLGDNSIRASEYGMKNLKLVAANLEKWTAESYDTYENLTTMYDKVGGEWLKYIYHVTANIGGVYETIKSEYDAGIVYAPVPKATQKAAVAFLNKEAFQTPAWALNKDMLNKFRKPGREEFAQKVQEIAINGVLSTSVLNRLILNEKRFGTENAYPLDEYLTDIEKGVFEELYSNKPIDSYRRFVQKRYVAFAAQILKMQGRTLDKATDQPDYGSTDMAATLVAHLAKLQQAAKQSAAISKDPLTRSHLQYMAELIDFTLKN
jgi:hypothetical protein